MKQVACFFDSIGVLTAGNFYCIYLDIDENELTNEDEHAANGDHPGSSQSICRSSFLCHL